MNEVEPSETVTARAVIRLSGTAFPVEITVPTRLVSLSEILPIFQGMAGAIIDQAEAAERSEGRSVSCRQGCGACCRQLVPIAEAEARELRDLVESFPEPRRTEVRNRFEAAARRLEAAGMLESLADPGRLTLDAARTFGLDYFRQGVACPFLEAESCSIHPDRPIACREYLVTSPAENCSDPSPKTVHCVPLAGQASTALRMLGADGKAPWVPLILALHWVESHPDPPPNRPGPEWLREFFEHLTGKSVPKQTEATGKT